MPTSFRSFLFRNRLFFIGICCLGIAVILMGLLPLSLWLENWLIQIRSAGWNVVWVNYSFMGDAFFAIGLCIYLSVFKKQPKLAGLVFISFCFTMLSLQLIHWLLQPSEGFSWHAESTQYLQTDYFFGSHHLKAASMLPSHHLAVFLAWTTVWVCFSRSWRLQYAAIAAIALMGFSRLYLNPEQQLGELLMGAAIGLTIGAAVVYSGHYRIWRASSWKQLHRMAKHPADRASEAGFWHPAG